MAGSIRDSGDFTGTNWGFLPLQPGQLASESSLSFLRSGFASELAGLAHLAGPEEFTGFKLFSAGIAPTFVGWDISAVAPTYAEGRAYWDATDHTLAVMTDTADVTLQVGQEFYVRATNKTGAPLTNGTAVYVNGAQGQRPTVAKALATATPSDRTIGLCTANIANNATGYVSTAGLVRGLDTSAWIEGTELFVSTTVAGALTSTRPTAPDHAIIIGIVTYQHAVHGTIQVKVHTGGTLAYLHDVKITSIANKDAMRYVSTNSRWENTDQAGWRDTASTWTALQTFSNGISCTALTQGASDFHYFGDSGTDGSWRIGRSGNNLVHERRESGSWVTKMTVEA